MAYIAQYTQRQKRALLTLVLEDGYTARAAADAAAVGVCTPDIRLPAFKIPVGTIADLAWRERRRRESQARAQLIEDDPAEAMRRMTREIGAIIESEIADATLEPVPQRTADLVSVAQAYAALVRATDIPRGKRMKAEQMRDHVTALRLQREADELHHAT